MNKHSRGLLVFRVVMLAVIAVLWLARGAQLAYYAGKSAARAETWAACREIHGGAP